MGAIGLARNPRVDSLRTRNRIYAACDEHVPVILRRGSSTSGGIAESVNGLMRCDHSAAIQCRDVVKNWLLDHPEVAHCDDGYWALRMVAV